MPLLDLRALLQHAAGNGYEVTAFEVLSLEAVDAVLAAAERAQSPIVLAVPAAALRERRKGRLLLAALQASAQETALPIVTCVHGAGDAGTLVEAIRAGCNAVTMTTAAGADALAMVRSTGVPVGIDLGEARDDASVLPESLDSDFVAQSADRGRGVLGLAAPRLHVHRFDSADAAEAVLRERRSAGQSEAALRDCPSWTPVEHVIVYNVEGLDEQGVESMMARGREVLGSIPGVQGIFTGRALTTNAAYRYCWLVRFAHAAVIPTYAGHPHHVEFANQLFRPVAGKRITIDYQGIDRVGPVQEVPDPAP